MLKQFERAMHAEMTRKEFLVALGVGILSIVGINTLLQLFSGNSRHNAAATYGSSSYGGPKFAVKSLK